MADEHMKVYINAIHHSSENMVQSNKGKQKTQSSNERTKSKKLGKDK
jgi:hypothetical protein